MKGGRHRGLLAALTLGLAAATSVAPPPVRVFVYALPRSFNLGLLADDIRSGCNLLCDNDCSYSQWAAEVMVHAWLLQHPARTLDPEEADLFFVPYYPVIDKRVSRPGSAILRLNSMAHETVFAAVAYRSYGLWKSVTNQTDRWWRRHEGRDHVLVLAKAPAPQYPLGMVTVFPTAAGTNKSLGIDTFDRPPPRPRWLRKQGPVVAQMLATELPPDADTSRHMVIPYPQLGAHWATLARQPRARPPTGEPKEFLAFFYGSEHGSFGRHYRHALLRNLQGHCGTACVAIVFPKRAGVPNGTVHASTPWRELMGRSTFCPVPGGDSRNSRRLYAAVLAGCVPVLIGEPHEHILPFEWALARDRWTLTVSLARLKRNGLIPDLRAVTPRRLRLLRAGVERARALTWWEWPYALGASSERFPRELERLSTQMEQLAHALPARRAGQAHAGPEAAAGRRVGPSSAAHENAEAATGAEGRLQTAKASGRSRFISEHPPSRASLAGGRFGGAFDALWKELERRALAARN